MQNKLMSMMLEKIKEQPEAFAKITKERMENAEAAMPPIATNVEHTAPPAPPVVESNASMATRHTHQRTGGSGDADGDGEPAFLKLRFTHARLREIQAELRQSYSLLPTSELKKWFADYALAELNRFDLLTNPSFLPLQQKTELRRQHKSRQKELVADPTGQDYALSSFETLGDLISIRRAAVGRAIQAGRKRKVGAT